MSDAAVCKAIINDVDAVLIDWIDAQHAKRPDQPKALIAVNVGRALMLLAGIYIGNAIGLEAEAGLAPALDCFRTYRSLAKSRGHDVGLED